MAEDVSKCTRLVVAAIDFGTTYSGYAFSFKDTPLDVKRNSGWVAGTEKLISPKAPTCVLLKPDRTFHSFGYEAENKYASLAEDGEHHGWLLFRHFKMFLHTEGVLNRHTHIDDISGKSVRALDIFAMAIRYLKDHLIALLKRQTTGLNDLVKGISIDDIQFVLTVPAIWDDRAKQFMREAAIEAGIPGNQLKLALESEAASIWCQVMSPDDKMKRLSRRGNKYMVVDLGGGTADITVHERMPNGSLKEVHRATGGPWGGTEVDNTYIQMLSDIYTDEIFENFKMNQIGDYFDILREFELKKRTVTNDNDCKVTVKIPASLTATFEKKGKKMEERISEMNYGKDLVLRGDKIRLNIEIAKEWFRNPVDGLIEHVVQLLQEDEMKDVEIILLAGGFAESDLVQSEFTKRITKPLIIPDEPGLAVLKGAVRFGHLPDIICSRKSKRSYGIEIWPGFDENIHPRNKRVVLYGETLCKHVYREMVKINEDVSIGKTYKSEQCPFSAVAETILINIFSCTDRSPRYITDKGCTKLGEKIVSLPEGNTMKEKGIIVEFHFGDTELHVTVLINKTGEAFSTTLDCF